jgi:large subunit ribosomal protein L3
MRSSAFAAAKTTPEPSVTEDATPPALAKWTPTSRRVGLIAKKIGMTTYFLPSGQRIPATVLQVSQNQISAHIGFSAPSMNKDGSAILPRKIESRLAYTALQVAATDSNGTSTITKQIKGHLRKAGITTSKKIIREFKVTKDALVPLGTFLSAAHFVPGQKIDVKSKSRGKGFQGPMKRHGFHGLRASHGVSVSHRSGGSTGMNQSPGRVFPGKKMAGRMGGDETTKHNLHVLRIDTVRDVILVKGNVPGPEGGHVLLSDAKRALIGKAANAFSKGILLDGKGRATGEEASDAYLPEGVVDLPFPAGTREMAKTLPEIVEVAPEVTVVKESS